MVHCFSYKNLSNDANLTGILNHHYVKTNAHGVVCVVLCAHTLVSAAYKFSFYI